MTANQIRGKMEIRKKLALCFDDVLLVPKFFKGESRKDVDISTSISGVNLKLPIISANMPGVTGAEMIELMHSVGGLGILDRMIPFQDQFLILKSLPKNTLKGASVGIDGGWYDHAAALIYNGANIICIDVAHAAQKKTKSVIEEFVKNFPGFPLIVGNYSNTKFCPPCGFYTAKIGIGGGSVCTTRIETGCGLPTLQSILDCDGVRDIIADGGIKSSGDIVKSLAAGANAVMIGSLLAGTDEAPGQILKDGRTGQKYKVYRGNASFGTKKESGQEVKHIEGTEALVPYKGSAVDVLSKLEAGIRSGMSYCGALNLRELKNNAEFVKISAAGMRESNPHGVL